jgi:hypothetical protein
MRAAARRWRRRSSGWAAGCAEEPKIQQRDLTRLDRILGLLASDNAGERASAAKAAAEFMKKHNLSWRELIEGRAAPQKGGRRAEIGVDYLEAAHSRIRQLQAHNAHLETQVRRLKAKLEAAEEDAEGLSSGPARTRAAGGRRDRQP